MLYKEIINRNITLSFDFLREIVKSPSKLDEIPDNSTIEFVEKDRPGLRAEKNKDPDKYFKVKHYFEKL